MRGSRGLVDDGGGGGLFRKFCLFLVGGVFGDGRFRIGALGDVIFGFVGGGDFLVGASVSSEARAAGLGKDCAATGSEDGDENFALESAGLRAGGAGDGGFDFDGAAMVGEGLG